MTAWLIRRFVRNNENVEDSNVRTAYGTLGSVVGVLVNLLLAGAKCLMGFLSGSLAMMADAANNLSDAAGSVVALITVRLAHKPVDAEHPFGHGRMEYLGSLAVGALIVCMGVTLLRDGISAILHPTAPQVNWVVMAVLAISILGKLWLYGFYRKLGSRTQNGTLLAAAKDSLGDVLATSAVLVSMLCCLFFGWKIDGWIGLLVSVIVLKAGWEVCRDTLDSLLGGRPDPEKIQELRELLLSREGIMGIHDLVLHDYGPGRCFASVHAEVDADGDILEIHELIDDAEREIGEKMKMPICIHMDPIVTSDENVQRVRQQISDFVCRIDPALSIHDFRMVPGDGHTNLIFDCVLPAGYTGRDTLMSALNAFALSLDERYRLVVQFDTDYT
ncbi:MAG: cation diffusion facilitator family transporter [bacterium]|nr:cation diffusion facilitator family transporter [bacterium]